MWSAIAQAISTEIDEDFHITNKNAISGGDINSAYLISDAKNQYFVKLNDKNKLNLFEAEAFNINAIAQSQQIHSTEVITTGTTLDKSYLVLKYCNFTQPTPENWATLGKELARMHLLTTHGKFGWPHDNYIGSNNQPNRWQSNWRTFFAEQRIAWQLQLLAEKSIVFGDIDYISSICHDLLCHHKVEPCLVHGDLWRGNVGFINKTPIIFDPACYYGDREVDIAMTELFGQFPNEFYQSYHENYPLPPCYEQRKHVYNFYHILNHVNLFKGSYIEQAQALLSRIIAMHEKQ